MSLEGLSVPGRPIFYQIGHKHEVISGNTIFSHSIIFFNKITFCIRTLTLLALHIDPGAPQGWLVIQILIRLCQDWQERLSSGVFWAPQALSHW